MKKHWHKMTMAVLAVGMGFSVFAGPASAQVQEKGFIETLKQFLPESMRETRPIDVSITLGATFTPWDVDDPTEMDYPSVSHLIDIDEDGAEIGRVATVAPEKLNLVAGRKYRLSVVNASDSTHYFQAPEFEALSAKTVAMSVDKGKIRNKAGGAPGEEYAAVEAEILPGGTAIWEFVPQVVGSYKYGCALPTHEMSGMKGEFIVTPELTG